MTTVEAKPPFSGLRNDPLKLLTLTGILSGLACYLVVLVLNSYDFGTKVGDAVRMCPGFILGAFITVALYRMRVLRSWPALVVITFCYLGWYAAFLTGEAAPTGHTGVVASPVGAAVAYLGLAFALPAARNVVFALVAVIGCTLYGYIFDLTNLWNVDSGFIVLFVIWQAIFCFAVGMAAKAQIAHPDPSAYGRSNPGLLTILLAGLVICAALFIVLRLILSI